MAPRVSARSDHSEIVAAAGAFRRAIDFCMPSGFDGAFKELPRCWCGYTTYLLGTHLERMGHGRFTYMLGYFGRNAHAWPRRGEVIVDITGSQLSLIPLPVFVGEGSTWHMALKPTPAGIATSKYSSATTIWSTSGRMTLSWVS